MRNYRSLTRACYAGVALVVVGAPALALAQETSTQLSTIVVEGKKQTATGPVDGYAARQTGTGSNPDQRDPAIRVGRRPRGD